MDRQIERRGPGKRVRVAVIAACVVGTLAALFVFASSQSSGQTQKVALKGMTVGKVVKGRFEEKLNVRGAVSARTTIYIDAIAGGIVEQKFVDRATYVKKDQPLLRLSNMNLQLEVISREAQISEQLNLLRNNQLLAENSMLQLRSDILENANQIRHLEQKVEQVRPLAQSGLLPRTQLQDLEQDLGYYRNRNRIAQERLQQEASIRSKQMTQLEASASMLQENLDESRKVLENLLVRAPVDGYLSEFDVELGESKPPGTRLGRIDVLGAFKLVASLDEYYINQVALGIPANVSINGKLCTASVTRIDGKVNNGKFLVEVDLPAEVDGQGVKVGQSLDVDIILAAGRSDTLMVERGPFLDETGGNWIFLLTEDGRKAVRRPIKLGARNKDFYEVVSGLRTGDAVIVSSYSTFDKADVLYLN